MISKDLRLALYNNRVLPVLVIPGTVLSLFLSGLWGFIFTASILMACLAFSLLLAMLFPLDQVLPPRRCYSFRYRLKQIKNGEATI